MSRTRAGAAETQPPGPRVPARPHPDRPVRGCGRPVCAAAVPLLWCALAAAGPDPCADWTLLVQPTPAAGTDLRLRLTHRAPRPARGDWSFYGLVQADPGGLPAALPTPARLAAARPPPVPLAALRLEGNANLVYAVSGWYDAASAWVLYLVRLPAPDPRLERLGLRVQVAVPVPVPAGQVAKFHGPLPPKVLPLEPARARAGAGGALVCRVRSRDERPGGGAPWPR